MASWSLTPPWFDMLRDGKFRRHLSGVKSGTRGTETAPQGQSSTSAHVNFGNDNSMESPWSVRVATTTTSQHLGDL